ncbi:MAG: hypothetical protein ACRDD1_22190, partial [Planctomycetia bacterium]
MRDLDELLDRSPRRGRSLTLVARHAAELPTEAVRDWALAALAGRPPGDEVLLLSTDAPVRPIPARAGGVRFRWFAAADPDDGPGLAIALREARRPIVVLADARRPLASAVVDELVDRLDGCDAVAGRRP